MFFKRVEIIGFKSFATRTLCEFIPGATIIVGPNGCGKSNIFDAIKWVLGEQAASQLRGKKMQDVIFAGSASFKALGVAQVTITVDNSRRILPMDYEEIQVTRRLFRSGESEYLLNKVPCRLRDIHDMFLGTGIGKSAYSILEQGRVDQIINAKPNERRFLIEEAAGISKFKVRKLEALRKLERTDIDLARLNDLLIEIERQVVSLKRQAGKAERYKELSDACLRAEKQMIVLRSAELRRQLKELDTGVNQLRDQLAALRTELDTKAVAEVGAREREEELNEALRDETQALSDLKTNLKACEGHIVRLNDQIGAHARRIEQIQEEFKDFDARGGEVQLRIQEAMLRENKARETLQDHQEREEALARHYAEFEESVRERTRLIDELTADSTTLREAIARADNEIRMAEALIENQARTKQEAADLLGLLKETCLTQEAHQEELSIQAHSLAAEVARLQREIEIQRGTKTESQQQLATAMGQMEQTRRQMHEGRSRLETLNELRASYEGYYQGVREVMLAVDRREISGILGVAANLVRARKEYELAIEVALATHLQDIVTRTAEDAKRAIDYLKHSGRGRATFLPLDRLQPALLAQNLREVLHKPGVIGLAADLVEHESQIEIAVQFMLGTTIVVRDLDVGLELGRMGYRGRFVSLDGQLINSGGSMTGGRIQTTGLMTREREIRDLQNSVQELENHHQALHDLIDRIQEQLSTDHARLESLHGELEQRRLEQAALLKDIESAQRGLSEAEKSLNERMSQIERIDKDIATKRDGIDQWRVRNKEAHQKLHDAEQRLDHERQALREQGEDYRVMGTSVAETRAEISKSKERIANSERERLELTRDLEGIERQRQIREREIETLGEEDIKLREQIVRIQSEMDVHRKDHEEMERRLSEDQVSREELSMQLKHFTQEVDRLTRDERELDNEFHERELRQMELQTTLNNISQQCLEKHGVGIEDLAEQVGEIEADPRALHVEVTEMHGKLERMGMVNLAALTEYQEQSKRLEFLQAQKKDLAEAKEQLESTIAKLDQTTRQLFHEAFEAVRGHFIEMFRRLFNGGKADLLLDAPDGVDPLLDGGLEIIAQPPGKQLKSITLLSGGEKALTAIALLFGLFLYKPSPFCMLDEIDAPLDDVNVERLKTLLREFRKNTQFIMVTHNKLTMELADALYGVTMEESGVSKMVSVRFEQAAELLDVV